MKKKMFKCNGGTAGAKQFAQELGFNSYEDFKTETGLMNADDKTEDGLIVVYAESGSQKVVDVKMAAESAEIGLANVVNNRLFVDKVTAFRFGNVWYVSEEDLFAHN